MVLGWDDASWGRLGLGRLDGAHAMRVLSIVKPTIEIYINFTQDSSRLHRHSRQWCEIVLAWS